MTLNTSRSCLQTLVALIRAKKARLKLAAALIAVALAFAAHSGARALAEARQAVLYVAAPSVPAAAAHHAGEIGSSYASSLSPTTLIALGLPPGTVRDHAIERALASVLQPPSKDMQMALTEEAALDAGRIYVAQRSGKLPTSREEYASAGPVRPRLGDGEVVEVQENHNTSPDSRSTPVLEKGAGSEEVYPGEEPVPVDRGVELAYTDAPDASGGVISPAADPRSDASSGPDLATLDGEPVELAASTEEESGTGSSSSMTGPVSDTEQVPTTLAEERMDPTAEEDAGGSVSEETSSEGGSPEQRTPSNHSSERRPQGQPHGGAEEPTVALDGESEQRSARTSGEQGLPHSLPSSSDTPAGDDQDAPPIGEQPELAGIPDEAAAGEGGGEVRAGGSPSSIQVAEGGSVEEEDAGGGPYAVIVLPSREDSAGGRESAQKAVPPARGSSVRQTAVPVPPGRDASSSPPGNGEIPPTSGELLPPKEGTPPSGPPQDEGQDSLQVRLLVRSPEESDAGEQAAQTPARGAADGATSGGQDEPLNEPELHGGVHGDGAKERSPAQEENRDGAGRDGISSPPGRAPESAKRTADSKLFGSDAPSPRLSSERWTPHAGRAGDHPDGAPRQPDKPESNASAPDMDASGPADATRSPSDSGAPPQPEARPTAAPSSHAADRRTAITQDRGRLRVEAAPQRQTTEGPQSITQARKPVGEASRQGPLCEPTHHPGSGQRTSASSGQEKVGDGRQQRK